MAITCLSPRRARMITRDHDWKVLLQGCASRSRNWLPWCENLIPLHLQRRNCSIECSLFYGISSQVIFHRLSCHLAEPARDHVGSTQTRLPWSIYCTTSPDINTTHLCERSVYLRPFLLMHLFLEFKKLCHRHEQRE